MFGMRIGGLASGMDIDQIVNNLMKAERMKVSQLEQRRQVLEWQQEHYRSINANLRSFRDNDIFNLRLQSTYMAKAATSGNQDVVTTKAGPNAIEGQYSIEVKQLAKGASITGGKIGSSINKSTLENQLNGLTDKQELNINGAVFKVDPKTDSIYELVSRINQHTTAGVSINTEQKAINPNEEGTGGVAQIQTLKLSGEALVDGLTLNIGGKKIVLYDSRMHENNAQIAKQRFKADEVVDIYDVDKGELKSVNDVMQGLFTTMDGAVELADITYENGEIKITSREEGLDKAVSVKVTGGKAWSVRASYDETLDRFFISTNKTGADQQLNIIATDLSDKLNITVGGISINTANFAPREDGTQPLLPLLPPGASVSYGQNAHVVINDLEIKDYTSNQFTLNGITYNLHNTSDSKITVSVKQDTDTILNTVVKFVDQYNKLVEELEKKLSEEKYKGYTWPLTDDQREKLTDKQLEQWEERARSGVLRKDNTLREIRDKLRFAVSSLSEIGIKTTADYMTAKLEVDENKLRQAIADNPQRVTELFAAEGDSVTNKGVARRLNEDLSYSINHIIDKAGANGSAKDDQSFIGKRLGDINDDLDRWETRLKQIENRYWRQFTAMEKAISQMNQQSAWLAQQFGGGM